MIKEHLDLIMVALVGLSLVIYDVMIDLVLSILHLVFVPIHFMYEWFELGLEHTVEFLFHTSRHGSQLITFYIMMLIAGLFIYWLWRVLPRLYKRFIQFVQQSWKRRKNECEEYWLSLTLSKKMKLLFTTAWIVYLTSYLVT